MKIAIVLKTVALLVFAIAILSAGYWWGQHEMNAANSNGTAAARKAVTNGSDAKRLQETASSPIRVSPDKQQIVGIRTAAVELRPLAKKIRTVGIVTYDETKMAHVYTKVDGWIEKLFVNYTGKLVKKGQPLFTLYSPDLVSTQEEYLLALQAKESLSASSFPEIRAGAASLLEATRRRLRLWDIAEEEIQEIEKNGEPKKHLTIFSPLGGFVIKKEAFQGMKVMPDREIYTIADLSTVWVNADTYEIDLPHVRVGQQAAISLSYFPGHTFTGRVSWIAPVLDEKTRTAKVRLEFANHDYLLKPEMYANVEILIDVGKRLAIPDEAVLDSGLRKVVFLDKGEGRFEPREVRLGAKYDGFFEVLSGLSAGEKILASASFLLDSESRLREAMSAMAGTTGAEMAESQKQEKAKPGKKSASRDAHQGLH
jgi:membrane fusion protein, copper/silver efflux system